MQTRCLLLTGQHIDFMNFMTVALDVRVQMPEDSVWNQEQVLVPDPQQAHSATSAVNK